MSELAVLAVGLVLCFAGARSLRLTVLVAGFGLCWLLADAFGANVATTFVVAAVGALALLVSSIVMSRFVIFVVGAAVGAVIGARLFALLGGDDPSWLLAVLFVPTFGFVAGFLAQRMGRSSFAGPPPSPVLPSSCRPSARCSATISDSCRRPTARRSRPCTPSRGSRWQSSATKFSAPRCAGRTPRRPTCGLSDRTPWDVSCERALGRLPSGGSRREAWRAIADTATRATQRGAAGVHSTSIRGRHRLFRGSWRVWSEGSRR